MRFGLFMMPAHDIRDNPTLAFERDLQLIEYTESLGFDEFWVGEHHSGGWETIPAPDIFLAAAASRTKRIRLGTAVINLPYHHPFHVAERMAFLDHLTYGRLMLGCGPGVLGPDMQLFDLDPRELRPMMNESVDIILKLYREAGLVYHEGDYWKINGMEVQIKSYQQPHLPVYLTSSGSGNSVRVAAERGLPLISAVFTLPNAMPLGKQWDTYEQVANEHGHQVDRNDWSLGNIPVYVAETNEQAFEDISAGAMHEITSYPFKGGGKSTYEAYPGQPEEEITFEQIVNQRRWIVGDPDHCIAQIEALQEDSGGFGALLMLTLEWTSTERWYRSLELFARYVMPQFKGSLRGITSSYERMVEDVKHGRMPSSRSERVLAPADRGQAR